MQPFEMTARREGYVRIAGIDEAGRGPLAGPVVAAAVILPPDFSSEDVRDSKKLSPKKREKLYGLITDVAVAWAVGAVEAAVIDSVRIVEATRLAMLKAVEGLSEKPDLLLIDGPAAVHSSVEERTIVHGDEICLSIAAASILAKVTRDRIMLKFHEEYPEYGFDRHKGYGTRAHVMALHTCGPSRVHRLSFEWAGGR